MLPTATLLAAMLALAGIAGCSAAGAPTPRPVPPRAAAGPALPEVDRRCRTDADCAVKNVGNCCGYHPACVNVDSPTDPDAVMAQCKASGRMSVCGFPQVTGCQCVGGQCTASGAGADTLRRPLEPTEPIR